MNELSELQKIDIFSWIITGFLILSAINASVTIIGKFSETIGKPVRWVRKREEERCLIYQNEKDIKELSRQREIDVQESIKHDKQIQGDLEKLTKLFVEKEVDDLRGEILNFASRLSSGSKVNQESFAHILRVHQKYERILQENNMENGLVTESFKYIQDQYQNHLRNGEFV